MSFSWGLLMNFHTKLTKLDTDPLVVFERLLGQHEQCFLLETLGDECQPQTSRQSYIGVAPEHCFTAKGKSFYVDGALQPTTSPYEALRQQITLDPTLQSGYIGGLVGYFAHEAVRYFEPSLEFLYKRDFPDFAFAQYNDGLVFGQGKSPQYFHYGRDRSDIYKGQAAKGSDLHVEFIKPVKSASEYSAMVDSARQDIQKGRAFQVILANKYDYRFSGDLLCLYKELRRINPSPFMFFIKFNDVITMGASPEMLEHVMPGGEIYLEALAGTIQRGDTPKQDAQLAAKLIHDEKEIAEHSMLVDLTRNDAGRVCEIGSVRIDSLMYVKKLSHVQHICSLVSGILEPGYDAFDALAASFPCGTLCGAPKVEAIKMISELEGYERGPYGGTIGYFSYNGDAMHATNLRSVNAVGNKLVLHSGSGIVYDSDPQREYAEIGYKKAAMDQAMQAFLEKETA